ncbi:hypothetical protein EB796_022752 [Bugula neritina]|uniref:Uncharacterized protein n=1 Tax=Bugula neritina TaxID=10212 RepID=A0A7J7IZT1_BUGNE|nr:hypothetical protein EB796_022752 [Bugula neritina]
MDTPHAYDQFLLPPSPCQEFRQENYLADSSMYLDDTWKHQPDYSSDSNPSMSPLHDYVPQSSPNLTSMTTFMPGSDYRIMGTSSTFNTPPAAVRGVVWLAK